CSSTAVLTRLLNDAGTAAGEGTTLWRLGNVVFATTSVSADRNATKYVPATTTKRTAKPVAKRSQPYLKIENELDRGVAENSDRSRATYSGSMVKRGSVATTL